MRYKLATAVTAVLVLLTSTTAPAQAGLLGNLVGTTMGLVDGVLSIVTAGWDDGATTAPTPMTDVNAAIGAQQMWSRGFDGTGIDVALIDSGVAPVQGLGGATKVVNGPDLSFESQSQYYRYLDTFGHGTHMGGIIGGNDGTSSGFKGVAPGSRLVNLKVATREGAADVSQVIAAIDWVVQHRQDGMNIRVLNLSFGTDGIQDRMVDPLAHAVESAWRNGIVVVVAGGNDGTSLASLTNPAHDPMVLAVGAVDLRGTVSSLDDRVAPFSSRGSSSRSVDLVAPGVSISSLRNPGSSIDDAHPGAVVSTRFFRGSGTSQAAAVTSGAAALLLDARPDLTPDQVNALLRASATPLLNDTGRAQGAGRLNVDLASRSLVPVGASQTSARSQGTGLIEGSRGTEHISDSGIDLRGEQDIMGTPWVGSVWAPLASAGSAGRVGRVGVVGRVLALGRVGRKLLVRHELDGQVMVRQELVGQVVVREELVDRSLVGKSWSGKSWSGTSWTGKSWSSKSWSGANWMSAARGAR